MCVVLLNWFNFVHLSGEEPEPHWLWNNCSKIQCSKSSKIRVVTASQVPKLQLGVWECCQSLGNIYTFTGPNSRWPWACYSHLLSVWLEFLNEARKIYIFMWNFLVCKKCWRQVQIYEKYNVGITKPLGGPDPDSGLQVCDPGLILGNHCWLWDGRGLWFW